MRAPRTGIKPIHDGPRDCVRVCPEPGFERDSRAVSAVPPDSSITGGRAGSRITGTAVDPSPTARLALRAAAEEPALFVSEPDSESSPPGENPEAPGRDDEVAPLREAPLFPLLPDWPLLPLVSIIPGPSAPGSPWSGSGV